MISIKIQSLTIQELQEKAKAIGQETELALVGAQGAANLVRDHLFNLDGSTVNQMFGPRTHFYASAAKSVTGSDSSKILPEKEGNGASFSITQVGLAQRWLGGTIRAGQGDSSATGRLTKYLTIPARAEAYGKTPGEFNDLQFIPRGNGKAMLVQRLQSSLLGAGGRRLKKPGARADKQLRGGLVMFWLVTEVHQEANPDVMPTEDEISAAAAEHMGNYLARLLQ